MGTLRTLFALAVVFTHTSGHFLIGGKNAVQLFYMISGFLISYILVERKVYVDVKSFYINRYLRIFPIYAVIATLTFITFIVTIPRHSEVIFFKIYRESPWSANLLLLYSNITLFMQDWVMFTGVDNNQLIFTTDFRNSQVVLYQGLLVPQAWTLGVELSFYLIAPFILHNKRIIILLLALSISIRILIFYIGLGYQDPWTYRFFPTELAFFLLGALAHQIELPFYKRFLTKKNLAVVSMAATYFLILFAIFYSFITINDIYKSLTLFAVFFLLMPLTFIFQSDRKWDKWIGDLSFTIYISHVYIITLFNYTIKDQLAAGNLSIMGKLISIDKIVSEVVIILLSILIAVMLNKFIGKPVETLRNNYRTLK